MNVRTDTKAEADQLFQRAMTYNWRNNSADAALARSLFETSARLGHVRAHSELAGMMFLGAGGPVQQAQAMALTWHAFAPGDVEPFEVLSELLNSYADGLGDAFEKQRAENATRKADEALELLKYLSAYVRGLSASGKT